jgi:hypothetical protein
MDPLATWNSYEQNNRFTTMKLLDMDLKTYTSKSSGWETKITFNLDTIKHKVMGYGSSKIESKREACAKLFSIYDYVFVPVNSCPIECDTNDDFHKTYNLINSINQNPILQKQYEISNIKFHITFLPETKMFFCDCNIYDNDLIIHSFSGSGSSKKSSMHDSVKRLAPWLFKRTSVKGQMDTPSILPIEVSPITADISQETAIYTSAPIASTLELAPMDTSNLLMTSSTSLEINSVEELTARWIPFETFKIERNSSVKYAPFKIWRLPKDVLTSAINLPSALFFKQYAQCQPTEMEIKIVTTSNKFNQGLLLFGYLNDGQLIEVKDAITDADAALSYTTYPQVLQRDHVLVDLNTSNTAILQIPYLSARNFVPISYPGAASAKNELTSALLTCHVLSDLLVPDEGQSFINVTMFFRFKNIKFTGLIPFAIPSSISGQGDDTISAADADRNELIIAYTDAMVERENNGLPTCSFENWQIDNSWGLYEDISSESDSPIYFEPSSNVSGQIGAGLIASVAAPVIGQVFKPIATAVGNIWAGIYNGIFGFLNPQRSDGGERRFNTSNQSFNLDKPAKHKQPNDLRPNFCGDTSIAVFSEPKTSFRLDPTALTPQLSKFFPNALVTNVHELCRVWSYIDRFDWLATQQTVGEELYSLDFSLNKFPGHSTLGYFSNMYNLWSGSVELKFMVVATQLHIGALDMAFIPYNSTFKHNDARASNYQTYELVDSRQFTFKLPYISPYMLHENSSDSLGTFKIFIRNCLVPVSTVSQSVEILVFARAGPDFQFTFLADPTLTLTDRTPSIVSGQMDTGDKETTDDMAPIGNLSHSGVVINIGEDHAVIGDILKRYNNSYSGQGSSFKINLDFPIKTTSASSMLLKSFRYARGSYSLCLLFEKITPEPPSTDAIDIEPMTIINNPPISSVPAPTTLVAPAPYNSVAVSQESFVTSSNDWSIFNQNESWYTLGAGIGVQQNVRFPQNVGNVGDMNNTRFTGITSDLNNVSSVSNLNRTSFDDFNTSARTAATNTDSNFVSTKTALDTNVGLNTFTGASRSATNSLISTLDSDINIINENSTKTNTNNVNLVAAINDGSGAIVAADTPAIIYVKFQKNNATGNSFCGAPTQIVNTSINPSLKITVPYYIKQNYLDYLDVTQPSGVLGEILVSCSVPVKMTSFWTASDEFYVTKFIGVPSNNKFLPSVISGQCDDPIPYNKFQAMEDLMSHYSDETITGQMDQIKNFCSKTSSRVTNSLASLKNSMNIVPRINQNLDNIERLTDQTSNIMNSIGETARSVVDFVKSKFTWIKCTDLLLSSIINLLQIFLNPTLPTVLLSISSVLLNLGILSSEYVLKIFTIIKNKLFCNNPPLNPSPNEDPTIPLEPTQQTSGDTVRAQCDHACRLCEHLVNCNSNCKFCSDQRPLFDSATIATIIGLIMASITSALGLKKEIKVSGLAYGLFKITGNFWTSITHSIKFLKDFISLIKRCYDRVINNNQATKLDVILSTAPDTLKTFVEEVATLTQQINRNAILNDPAMKNRFWMCVTSAHKFQSLFLTNSSSALNRHVLHHCEKIINLSNEITINATNAPVRYEPFVLALIGDSGLGKSFLLQALIPELLRDVYNYESFTSPVYVRTPGTEYWNGYNGQPCIVYDDFLASLQPEIASRTVIELFNLKSSALMNCNMADLSDKKMMANPLLVTLNMNKQIVPNGIACPQAFLRRKDSFWRVVSTPRGKNPRPSFNQWSSEELKNFDHLQFEFIPNPNNETARHQRINFTEFKTMLSAQMKQYHEREVENVKYRFQQLSLTLPNSYRNITEDIDPFFVFYNSVVSSSESCRRIQTGLLPSEVLQHQLEYISSLRNQHVTPPIIELPPIPEDAEPQADGFFKRNYTRFSKRIWNTTYRTIFNLDHRDVEDPFGTCGCCLEDKPLHSFCESNVRHGYCQNCILSGLANNATTPTRCGECREPLYQNYNNFSPNVSQLWNLVKNSSRQRYANFASNIQNLARSPTFWLCAFTFAIVGMKILLSRIVAPVIAENQEFIADCFNVPYKGGVSNFGPYYWYDKDKHNHDGVRDNILTHMPYYTPIRSEEGPTSHHWTLQETIPLPGAIYSKMDSMNTITSENTNLDKLRDEQIWDYADRWHNETCEDHIYNLPEKERFNFLRKHIPLEDDNIFQDRLEQYDIAKAQADEPTEILRYSSFEIWPITDPIPLRPSASTSECIHHHLETALPGHIHYSIQLDTLAKYGVWFIFGNSIDIPDARCCINCIYNQEFRQKIVKKFAAGRMSCISSVLNNLSRENITHSSIPLDFINPNYLTSRQEVDPAFLELLAQHNKKSIFDYLPDPFSKFLKCISIAVAAIGFLSGIFYGIHKLYQLIKGEDTSDEAEPQMNVSGDSKTFKLNKIKAPNSIFKTRVAGQSGNQQHLESARAKIMRNTVIIKITFEEMEKGEKIKKNLWIRAIGLFSRTIMLTAHELSVLLHYRKKCIDDGLLFETTIKNFYPIGNDPNTPKEIVFNTEDARFSNSDLAFYNLPCKLPQFVDIVNLIANSKQHSSQYSKLLFIHADKHDNFCHTVPAKFIKVKSNTTTERTARHDSFITTTSYISNFEGAGSCGSLGLIDANNPIFCLHYGGSTPFGYSVPLIKEDIEKLKLDQVPYDYIEGEFYKGHSTVQPQGDYFNVGVVSKNMTAYQSSKSKIIPSLIQNKIEKPLLTQVPILSNMDPRYGFPNSSPLKAGIAKRCKPLKDLPSDLVDQAFYDLRSMILEKNKPIRTPGILDLETTIVGIPNTPYYDRIKLNTSAGYPYNLKKGCTTKDSYISIEEDEKGIPIKMIVNQTLIDDLDFKTHLRNNGIRPITIFQSTLKDERREQRKLDLEAPTRIFEQSPVDFTIHVRQYTLDFSAAYMHNLEQLNHAVGVTADGPQWGLIASKLLSKGNNIISGDFSDFGPRMWYTLIKKSGLIIRDWYKHFGSFTPSEWEKFNNNILIMIEEIGNSYNICNNLVFQTYCGLPSGNAITTILNTLCNQLIMRICWLGIMKTDLSNYHKYVSEIMYGDDSLLSVHDIVKEQFNCQTISQFLKQYDFNYTDATKTGNIKYTKLSEATFLKRGFKKHPNYKNQYLAPLSEKSVTEAAQWVFKSSDLAEATLVNCKQALNLAYGHGPEYFDDLKLLINKALVEVDLEPIFITWEELNNLFFNRYEQEYINDYVFKSYSPDLVDEPVLNNQFVNPIKQKLHLETPYIVLTQKHSLELHNSEPIYDHNFKNL